MQSSFLTSGSFSWTQDQTQTHIPEARAVAQPWSGVWGGGGNQAGAGHQGPPPGHRVSERGFAGDREAVSSCVPTGTRLCQGAVPITGDASCMTSV